MHWRLCRFLSSWNNGKVCVAFSNVRFALHIHWNRYTERSLLIFSLSLNILLAISLSILFRCANGVTFILSSVVQVPFHCALLSCYCYHKKFMSHARCKRFNIVNIASALHLQLQLQLFISSNANNCCDYVCLFALCAQIKMKKVLKRKRPEVEEQKRLSNSTFERETAECVCACGV